MSEHELKSLVLSSWRDASDPRRNSVKRFWQFGPAVVGFAAVWAPITAVNRDVWDGATLSFAATTGQLGGLYVLFEESGLLQFRWYWQTLMQIAGASQFSYFALSVFFAVVAHQVLIRETQLMFNRSTLVSPFVANVGVILLAVFPLGWLFHSSVLHVYLVFSAAGFVGSRFIVERRSALLFVPLLVFAYGYNSMLLVVPALIVTQELLRTGRLRILTRASVTAFGIALSVYVILRIGFTPSGLYEGYNNLVLPSSRSEAGELVRSTVEAVMSLLPVGAALLALALAGAWRKGRCRRHETQMLGASCILAVGAILPYVAVGKTANIFETQQWSARHALPLVLVLPLIFALSASPLYARLEGQRLWFGRFAVLAVVLVHASLLFAGTETIHNRQSFDRALSGVISENFGSVPPGRVFIFGTGIPGPLIDPPEVNRMFFDATGRLDWYAVVDRKSRRTTGQVTEADLVPVSWSDPRYGLKYLHIPPTGPVCATVWEIDVVPSGRGTWPRPLGPDPTVAIISRDVACTSES